MATAVRSGSVPEVSQSRSGHHHFRAISPSRLLRRPKERLQEFRQRVEDYREEQVQKLQKTIAKQLAELQNPVFLRTQDKILFTLGVINLCSLSWLVAAAPDWVPLWYLAWALFLIPLRFVIYHKSKEHYFMLDFCYLANYMLVFYLFLLPVSPILFNIVFTCANGPLLWAIVTWRNSLVFHDMDKMTSVFIHALPPIVTYLVRWSPSLAKSYRVDNDAPVAEFYWGALAIYVYWQVCYYLKTEWIDIPVLYKQATAADDSSASLSEFISSGPLSKTPSSTGLRVGKVDSDHITSFRYLSQPTSRSIVFTILSRTKPQYQLYVFMGLQLLYTVSTMAPIPLLYHYQVLHTALLLLVLAVSVWNGAVYFIDQFSIRYALKLQKLSAQIAEMPPTPSVEGSSNELHVEAETHGEETRSTSSRSESSTSGSA